MSQPPGPEDLIRVMREEGVVDGRVLNAVRRTPRAEFVPAEDAAWAYADAPMAIPHGQVTTQPSLIGRMVQALDLTGSEHVLEVGTGYGWQTALLARLARRVWSVERWPDLAEAARSNLARAGVEGAEVVTGDGSEGLPDAAPFDAILVAAAFPEVPSPLAEQLGEGGRLVQPVGPGGADEVVRFTKDGGRLRPTRQIVPARFVRLHGRHGFAGE